MQPFVLFARRCQSLRQAPHTSSSAPRPVGYPAHCHAAKLYQPVVRTRLQTLSVQLLLAFCLAVAVAVAQPVAFAEDKITYKQRADDSRIERDFADGLRWANAKLDKDHTRIRAYNGYVLLYGSVPSDELKARAAEHATNLPGVGRVFNQLEVDVPMPSWLDQQLFNAKIRSSLITTTRLDGSKIKFESFYQRVFLLGLVTSDEARDAVDTISVVKGVREIVTLFEYLD